MGRKHEKFTAVNMATTAGLALMVIGALLVLVNFKNIFHSTWINQDYVSDSVSEMRMNYAILGETFDSGTREMYSQIYQKDANSGNMAIIGIAICVISMICLAFAFFLSLKQKSMLELQKQTTILSEIRKVSTPQSLEQRLVEIEALKNQGLITDDEYALIRENLINSAKTM